MGRVMRRVRRKLTVHGSKTPPSSNIKYEKTYRTSLSQRGSKVFSYLLERRFECKLRIGGARAELLHPLRLRVATARAPNA